MQKKKKKKRKEKENNTQRRNLGKTLWEIHGEDIWHGQPECTRCAQEVSRHQKQRAIKELREDLNKYQSETNDTIKREVHELRPQKL
jgi:hypothetical protein